jgi:hypothetical protein
LYPDAEQ